MIQLKSEEEISKIKKASRIVASVLEALAGLVKPGCATIDLDKTAAQLIEKENAESAFKGYRGYPAHICASVNSAVVHGIPGAYRLKEGDIVGLDVGVRLNGYCGDGAVTVCVGKVSPAVEKLVNTSRQCLNEAVKQAFAGNRIGDISNAIQAHAEANGFSVVREYVGHGIGVSVHEDPGIPNYGEPNTGLRIKEGMVLAIETMINLGGWQVRLLDDGWTAVTKDAKPSAHFEHTVAVTKNGPQVLTVTTA